MFIDTHCHLSKCDYDNVDEVIKNALDNNVKYLIISGWSRDTIRDSIEVANKYENVYLSIGYHPSEADITTEEDLEELKKLAKENPKVIAIGEIGLDYHWVKDNKDKQIELFKKQIEIAKELNLPLVIHSRDAFQDTFDILKESKHVGVIHCFSGNKENARDYLSIGFYLGIGGVLTFKNTNLKDTLLTIPVDKILLETDSPYLAPTPHRGEKNEPKYIPIIAEEISKLLNKDIKEIAEITKKNASILFNKKFNR